MATRRTLLHRSGLAAGVLAIGFQRWRSGGPERLYSHDAGRREASLAFDVGQDTQDLGFRNEVPILFDCGRQA